MNKRKNIRKAIELYEQGIISKQFLKEVAANSLSLEIETKLERAMMKRIRPDEWPSGHSTLPHTMPSDTSWRNKKKQAPINWKQLIQHIFNVVVVIGVIPLWLAAIILEVSYGYSGAISVMCCAITLVLLLLTDGYREDYKRSAIHVLPTLFKWIVKTTRPK